MKCVRTSDSKVAVYYQPKVLVFEITEAERALIKALYINNKVQCIKFIRNQYNIGLYDAKTICEVVAYSSYYPEGNDD